MAQNFLMLEVCMDLLVVIYWVVIYWVDICLIHLGGYLL